MKRIFIYVGSVALGALVAAVLLGNMPNVVPTLVAAVGIEQTYKVPTAQEIIEKYGSQVDKSDGSIALGPDGSFTVPVGGSDGSSGNGGGGTSDGGSISDDPGNYTDAGNSSAGENYCPETRAENPSVWDSCRAGYVAPTIQWGGVTSCTAIDKNAGTWSIHYKWNVVGGNWKGSWDIGATQDGTMSTTLYTAPGEADPELILAGASATIIATDMNGWGWKIDDIYSPVFGGVVMNTVCH